MNHLLVFAVGLLLIAVAYIAVRAAISAYFHERYRYHQRVLSSMEKEAAKQEDGQ